MLSIDPRTAEDIDARIRKIFREMGITEPPLNLEDLLEHLKLHRRYYDLSDPGLIDEVKHRLQIGKQRFFEIIGKVNLLGLSFPDKREILLDEKTPKAKIRHVTAHEVVHQLLPTHRLLLGDTAETIAPDYHEMVEAEANYGASSLNFLLDRFTSEALDHKIEISSVLSLRKNYQTSIASTFRRFVEFSHHIPLAGLIYKPSWLPSGGENSRRHYFGSPKFKTMFPDVTLEMALAVAEGFTFKTKGGKAGQGSFNLVDANGDAHEFTGESFCNHYDILSLFKHVRKL